MRSILTIQLFSAVVSIILLFTFYLILGLGLASGMAVFDSLLLIVIAIILLAILVTVAKIEYTLKEKGRVRK